MFYLLVMFVYFFQVELLVALVWTVYYVIEAGVKHLVQISIVALVLTERIVEFVGSLEPGEDQQDHEQLQQQNFK